MNNLDLNNPEDRIKAMNTLGFARWKMQDSGEWKSPSGRTYSSLKNAWHAWRSNPHRGEEFKPRAAQGGR